MRSTLNIDRPGLARACRRFAVLLKASLLCLIAGACAAQAWGQTVAPVRAHAPDQAPGQAPDQASGKASGKAPLQLAVAANFAVPMQRLAQAFEAQTGHQVRISSGSTGKLYAQIVNGAPFDAFFAADTEAPARLEQSSHAVAGTRFTYAVGALALWSATPGLVDGAGEVLRRGQFRKLAVANPKTAPYGAAAVQVMQGLGVFDRLKDKLVQGESIAQAYQFVASGNAELGFVALSQLMPLEGPATGSLWRVPAHLHQPIRQDAVLLPRAQNKAAAQALWTFLASEPAHRLILQAGYRLPERP
jgi:molybdate transport system substrate-binding protein